MAIFMMVNGKIINEMDMVILIFIIGLYHYKLGSKYEGQWKEDQKDGKGNN